MILQTKAIVLSRLNYSESDMIVRLYTEKKGILSILLKGVRKARNSKTAFFQPLNILETIINYNEKKELHYSREISTAFQLKNIHYDIKKTAISFFISELTFKTISHHETDGNLYQFIENSILYLDQTESSFSDFHLVYMAKLASFLGFGISNSTETELALKLSSRQNFDIELINTFKALGEINYLNMEELKLNNTSRQKLLDALIDYYYFHIENLQPIKSREVLSTLFNA